MFGNYSNQQNINLIMNQLAGPVESQLTTLYNSGKIDINQYNKLKLIIQEMFPQYCQNLIMMYPQGIPGQSMNQIVADIITKAIQIYNSKLGGQPNMFGQQNMSSFNPYGGSNTGFNINTSPSGATVNVQTSNNIFGNNQTTTNPSSNNIFSNPPTKDNKSDLLNNIPDNNDNKQTEHKVTINKKILNKITKKEFDFQSIIKLDEYKDVFNNRYAIGEFQFNGGTFNNEYELIKSFLKVNKNICSRSNDWMIIIHYPQYLYSEQKLDKFKKQFDEVRKSVITNTDDIDEIIKTFYEQSHEFVIFWNDILIEDINKRLRRFVVTDETIEDYFEIESFNDINDLYELELTDPDNPIVKHPKYKNMITQIVLDSFNEYFNKHLTGVFKKDNINEIVFCNDVITINDKLKHQYLKDILNGEEIKDNDIKNFTVLNRMNHVLITNMLFKEKELIRDVLNGTIVVLDKVPTNIDSLSLEQKVENFTNNFSLLISELYKKEFLLDVYLITPDRNIFTEIGLGKTMDGSIFLFKI